MKNKTKNEMKNEMEILKDALQRILNLTHQDDDGRRMFCEEHDIDPCSYHPYVCGAISAIAEYTLEKIG